jgi:cyanophycinase
MKKILITILINWATLSLATAQGYTKWVNGDTSDVVTPHQPGTVLAGGGTDNDSAMVWMLRRAAGGDVVIIRASGSNGYNSYFFSELGVAVNSVETIRFDNATAATNPYVIQKIRGAEVLFIAGGDQYKYYQYWKDTPIEDAINYLLNEKKITIGGTSAGMAILGEAYYVPPGASLTSAEALANPFHTNTNIIGKGGFLDVPFMKALITDTHYDQRTRAGRHTTFLARLVQETGARTYGIASNEHVAVCVDGAGKAIVYGSDAATDEFAYFLRSNCQTQPNPEVISELAPLTWNRQQSAVQVYKVPGSMTPTHTFDLTDWETTTGGGTWEDWYVAQGAFNQIPNGTGDCDVTNATNDPAAQATTVHIWPNPVQDFFVISSSKSMPCDVVVHDSTGKVVWSANAVQPNAQVALPKMAAGSYWAQVVQDGVQSAVRFVVQ